MSRWMRFDWLSSKKPDRRTLAVRGRPVTAFFRPLRFEPLEDRRLLSITVNTLFDENDGIGVGGVSLREAIVAAMPGETIDFSVTGTINLSSLGQLTINKDLTINGPGANLLTIRAFDPNATVGNGTHVFSVDDGNFTADKTIAISGLTITGGDAVASGNFTAGAIQSFENLSITASTITGNRVTGGPGGGIWQYGGSLTISASTISGNTSTRGGGIYAFNAVNVVVSAGTISGNTATSTFGIGGGGIVNNNGTLTVTNSTISGNSTNANGGGIHNNSFFGSLTVRHSTITGNRADADNNGSGRGGGVYDRYGTASIDHTIAAGNVRSVSTRDDVGGGAVSARYSLIGDGTGATITDNGGNQIGTGGAPIDPLLGPLTDNGGPAQTHALLAGSPAIDMGDPAFTAPPTEDQRGAPFVRVVDGDGSGGARIDIGAYERQTLVGPQALVVDTIVDEWDGNFSAGDLSLREALALANHTVGAGTISFAAALTSGGPATILLMRGELAISDALTINGPGASLLTIDASGNDPTPDLRFGDGSRVFRIDDALSTILLDVEIHGLTLTGGDVSGPGGTIFAAENLTIADSIITGNRGEGGVASTVVGEIYSSNGATSPNSLTVLDSTIRDSSGGAIRKIEGSLVIERSSILTNQAIVGAGVSATGVSVNVQIRESTLAGNVAANRGGGMFLDGGSATLVNTTISNNGTQAIGANGSGLYISSGAAVLRHCTITRNDFGGDNRASGIVARGDTGATIQVYSSIIAGNSFFFGFADVVFVNGVNPFQSLGYNVVGAGSGRDAFSAATNDQPGVFSSFAVTRLAPLADNGGPTLTHLPLPGSPAIDAGDPAAIAGAGGVPEFDQRGAPFARILDGDDEGGARMDIGAAENSVARFTVDTLVDEDDLIHQPGDLSLREAIALVNASPQFSVIDFSPTLHGGTIALTELGQLTISRAMKIVGPGASLLTIQGFDPSPAITNGDGPRLFAITVPSTEGDVGISGLTLTGVDTSSDGGAIHFSSAALTLQEVVINDNHTTARGGGVALAGLGAFMIIDRTTINGNTAGSRGGGIYIDGKVIIANSTVSGNSAAAGGGIFNYDDRTTIRHSTITANSAPTGLGGGIVSFGDSVTHTEVHSSIISGNIGDDVRFDYGPVNSFRSYGYNLMGTGNALAAFNEPGDQTGVPNPLLGPLADNGGPTLTHALLAGSTAIDAGDPSFDPADPDGDPMTADAIPFDQRGAPFTRVFDGDGAGGARIDIGAFELRPIGPALPGDYNQNGVVDAADYVLWRKTLGTSIANYSGADGSGDGMVGPEDHGVWTAHFGETLPAGTGSGGSVEGGVGSGEGANQFRISDFGIRIEDSRELRVKSREPERGQVAIAGSSWRDDALLAWLVSQTFGGSRSDPGTLAIDKPVNDLRGVDFDALAAALNALRSGNGRWASRLIGKAGR